MPLIPLIDYINSGVVVPPIIIIPEVAGAIKPHKPKAKEQLGLVEIAVALITIIRRRKKQ